MTKAQRRRTKKGPDDVDRLIGMRLRALRLDHEMSQSTLAESLGVTFQQVQKYEKGGNRISGSRLLQCAKTFNVGVEHFFAADKKGGGPGNPVLELAQSDHGMRIAKAVLAMPQDTRAALTHLVEVIATQGPARTA